MGIIDRIIEEFRNRGFRIRIVRDDSIKADLNRLRAKAGLFQGVTFHGGQTHLT